MSFGVTDSTVLRPNNSSPELKVFLSCDGELKSLDYAFSYGVSSGERGLCFDLIGPPSPLCIICCRLQDCWW